MSDLLFSTQARRLLSLWLKGRERVKAIPLERWYQFLHGDTTFITFNELSAIVDCCGYSILRLMMSEDGAQQEYADPQ